MAEIEVPDTEAAHLNLVHAQELPWEQQVRIGFNEERRIIYVYDTIETDFGDWFLKVYDHLALLSPDPIQVRINTEGGDCQSMFEFIDIVRGGSVEVHVTGIGNVCSAGVLMLACGHRRFVSRHCVMMVHQYTHGEGPSGLRYTDAKDRRKWEDWTHVRMIELMAEFSSNEDKDVKYWKGILERKGEHWLFGQDIVDEGLADEVLPW